MKRYLKYILLSLVAASLAVSCLEELEPTPSLTANDEVAVLVPRVKSFTNQYVTKSDYNEAEITLTSLKVLVFNKGGKLIHHQDVPVDSRTISLNKSMLNSPDNGDLSSATVVMLANMDLARLKKGDTPLSNNLSALQLDDLENYSYSHEQTVYTSLESGFKGFPMIGGTTGVDLSPTSSTSQQAPVVVDLKILYAKVNFEISVDQDGENQRVDPSNTKQMQFQLDKYAVYNASKVTTLAIPNNEGEPVRDFLGNVPDESNIPGTDEATFSADYAYTSGAGANLNINKTVTLGGEPILFTFYIAESRYNHNLTLEELRGIYPDSGWVTSAQNDDVKGWENLSAEEKKLPQNKLNNVKYLYDDLIQQYKPKLADVAGASPDKGKASYVLLTGKYTDYRGTVWDVDYKVYLGKDNSQNFHVDRNSEYTNYISIKGIRNNDDYYDKDENGNKVDQHIWIDHRVNVSYNGSGVDDHVTITRETLLDAHIEVRPLRVKWDNNEFDGVRIYLPTNDNGSLVDWIGIERFTGNNNADGSTYCLIDDEANPGKKKSSGKRKYFTTDLISELQTKEGEYGVRVDEDTYKKYIYLLNGDCAWIYFDENLGSADRPAEIRLEFYTPSGKTKDVVYKVNQRGLQTVGGYAIESYEEYLHSYDSEDKYNLSTSPVDYTQQGLAWGFQDHKLSQSILVSSIDAPLKDDMIKLYSYDYFHERDNSSFKPYKKTSGSWAIASFGTGHTFTELASANRDIAVRDMGTIPENAYQYCLSKNKFEVVDLEEVTMTINWYLPDAYEMQAILDAGQSGNSTADFDSDAFYWSSQPSYDTELQMYINEDIENAIAVSAQGGIDDRPRNNQNRIRCVYNPNAKPISPEDMEDRVPDGIGGNYSIYMKAWYNGENAYFSGYLPEENISKNTVEYIYDDDSFIYPTKANSYQNSDAEFNYFITEDKYGNTVEGFSLDPSNTNNWNVGTYYNSAQMLQTANGYYTTLFKYPGLSSFTLKKHSEGDFSAPTSEEKIDKEIKTETSTIKLEKDLPSSTDLSSLDPGKMLNINFGNPQGSMNPTFVYDELVYDNKIENTRKWNVPTYELDSYEVEGDSKTVSYTTTAEHTGEQLGSILGYDLGKMSAFGSIKIDLGWLGQYEFGEGAYSKAKAAAWEGLKKLIKEQYPNYLYDNDPKAADYTDLEWNSKVSEDIIKYTIVKSSRTGKQYKCECKVTCSIEITLDSKTEYYRDATNGGWGEPSEEKSFKDPKINADELRMYCGNSFTISLSQAAKNEGYEITKVKVYYSGDNYVDETGGFLGYGTDKVYARFVESTIDLSKHKLENQPIIGSTEMLQLPGMDYSADGKKGWHQWTGESNTSVTLVLADYNVNYNAASFSYSYLYDTTPLKSSKYIIVDQIDVKCSKKKKATFDFKQIYTENGNTETSSWTVKHITFTAEGGTEDNPSGVTAEGLKLYAGSKVTFKALDGYVINSISGDESLKFTGTEQVVERTIPTDKTITAPIVVLYSKADPGTN